MIDHMPRYERIWMILGISSLILFLVIIGVLGIYIGFVPAGHIHASAPELVTQTAPFNEPSITQVGDNAYNVAMVAQVFAFTPGDIIIPEGATVHFSITSPDVVHGLLIPHTNVNIMVLPGHISEFTYTFDKSGEYVMLCHEYCGIGHQVMMGTLVVE